MAELRVNNVPFFKVTNKINKYSIQVTLTK